VKHQKLERFRKIIHRSDFEHVLDMKMINTIILEYLPNPGNESLYVHKIEEFLNNLESFCRWIGGDIKNIKKGYVACEEELIKVIKLFKEQPLRRKAIPGKHLRKINKNFLYGLLRISKGVVEAFSPEIIGKTNLKPDQITRYILDDDVGLGKRFEFNSKGGYAFARKLGELNRQELVAVIKLLLKPSGNQVRLFNGWKDLGRGRAPIRILAKYKFLRKPRIYFLYRINEHPQYTRQLRIPSDEVSFSPL